MKEFFSTPEGGALIMSIVALIIRAIEKRLDKRKSKKNG